MALIDVRRHLTPFARLSQGTVRRFINTSILKSNQQKKTDIFSDDRFYIQKRNEYDPKIACLPSRLLIDDIKSCVWDFSSNVGFRDTESEFLYLKLKSPALCLNSRVSLIFFSMTRCVQAK